MPTDAITGDLPETYKLKKKAIHFLTGVTDAFKMKNLSTVKYEGWLINFELVLRDLSRDAYLQPYNSLTS